MHLFAQGISKPPQGLHPIDYGIVLVYLVCTVGAGIYFARHQKKDQDYFDAGRRMPWFAVGLSLIASLMSTVTYLAAPGEVLQHGLAMTLGWLGLPLAFLIVNRLWIPFFMRLGTTSIYEYLEHRFGLATRFLGVGLFVFVLRLFWMSTVIVTASRAVAQITYPGLQQLFTHPPSHDQWVVVVLAMVGIFATVYTMLGGITAVIWTDVVQFVVLFGGLIATLVVIAVQTDTGPAHWWQATVTESQSGHSWPPLCSWDITVRNTALFSIVNLICWYSCTFIGDQVAVQRYLTTPSVNAAVRGNIVNFVGELMMVGLLAICGMALLKYYLNPQFQTVIADGISDPRHPTVADRVFPHFIAHGLPVGMSGLVVAALFAVAMSSLDSGINSVSTVLTVDVFDRLNLNAKRHSRLRLAQALSLVVGLLCTGLAWLLLFIPDRYNIIGVTARTFNCALGPLGAMFMTGMFLKRVGQTVVITSTVCGLVVALSAAWWVELLWVLRLTECETLASAQQILRGPSPYLIAPLSVLASLSSAAVFGGIFPTHQKHGAESFCWKSIVNQSPVNAR